MPPKRKYDLETVVNAAFQILKRDGFNAITARSIAQELGSSTTPIYWVLDSMDKVVEALRVKTIGLLAEYQTRKFTENVFINLAIGYVEFARQEPNLFRFIYLEGQEPLNPEEEGVFANRITSILHGKPPYETYFGKVDQKSMDQLTLQSWIFTHGLAVALSTKMISFQSEKEIESMLTAAGSAFYQQQINQKKG